MAACPLKVATFDQLRGFGSYSFAKSHAAAFAVLVYQSVWLKRYDCAAFYTALLNNQPMGFWTPAILVNEARRQGIAVLPVDVAVSQEKCTVADGRVRLGLGYVKGLSQAQMDAILRWSSESAGGASGAAERQITDGKM